MVIEFVYIFASMLLLLLLGDARAQPKRGAKGRRKNLHTNSHTFTCDRQTGTWIKTLMHRKLKCWIYLMHFYLIANITLCTSVGLQLMDIHLQTSIHSYGGGSQQKDGFMIWYFFVDFYFFPPFSSFWVLCLEATFQITCETYVFVLYILI